LTLDRREVMGEVFIEDACVECQELTPEFLNGPNVRKRISPFGSGGLDVTMATMVCFQFIRWRRIWGAACLRKRRAPRGKRKRTKGSAPAAGIARRKPRVKPLWPDQRARRKRLVKQLLPELDSRWDRKPRSNKTKLPPAGSEH
jgi:hypothetical protein